MREFWEEWMEDEKKLENDGSNQGKDQADKKKSIKGDEG